jgi:hypothetical protein
VVVVERKVEDMGLIGKEGRSSRKVKQARETTLLNSAQTTICLRKK